MQWRFSLLMLWEPPDDISDREQRRMQKRLLSEYTSLGAPFPFRQSGAQSAEASQHWVVPHLRQHAATLLSACGPPRGRLPPLSIDRSWFAKSNHRVSASGRELSTCIVCPTWQHSGRVGE